MKTKYIVIAMFFAALLIPVFCVNAQAQSTEKRIADIQIKGNSSISTATIVNRLKIQPGDIFEESALNKELKRLYAMGFFSDVFIEVEEHAEGILVMITVVEKPLIADIKFQGNVKLKRSKLLNKITIKEGALLDFNQIANDVSAIKSYYVDEGYYHVNVEYRIETNETGDRADVIFVIDEGMALRVKQIDFEGNFSIPSGELKKLMSIRTAWWFIRKGAFDEEKFESDLARIATYYRTKGFLDVQTSSRVEYSENDKDIYITVVIDEGKKYLVGDIKVTGELAFPGEEVRDLILMRTDDPFDYEMMKEDIENVRLFYYDRGYMNAEIDMQHRYNPTTDRMDLTYIIDSHDEIYVGRINILGNTKTRDNVIRREVRVYPGERYDGKSLRRSKERIYNLGFFEDVYFETVPTEEKDVKDLNVTVKETKTGEFSFGGGYSSIDSFIGFAQIRQKNFDIMDFPAFTGGGQDLTVRAEVGSSRTNYFLSWTDPWILGYPLLFGFDVYREQHDRSGISGYGYDETRTGGSLRFGKELTEYLAMGLIYNLEEVKISSIPDNATEALRKESGTNLISRLTWNVSYDRRDNRFSPTKGFITGCSLENAGGFIGGDKDFVKGWFHGSYYHSIIENVVLELKGRVGLSDNYGDSDDIPIYERYFAGGATTIRGYEQRAVGPRDPGSNVAIGGEALVIGNAEVTFPIYKNMIKGAVFYDVGNVWASVRDIFSGNDTDVSGSKHSGGYKQGTGIGVRVKTPIGPVKLDYGFPLNDNYDDEKEGQFYFSVSHGF